ncbi:MAG: hypothetical protein JNM17_33075 [Archangium sp.]|nr:hypothetical protein [Archangium sp.]
MSNTIKPKTPVVSTPKPAESAKPAAASSTSAPKTNAGWGATGAARTPSPTAVSIAPGSGKTEVMCPVLRALANEGRVQLRADGTVSVDELNRAIKELGGSRPLGAATWAIGTIGNKPTDILKNIINHEFSLTKLPEGIVPHPADTQILRNGKFDEAKFNELVKHADRGVMTTESFANAIADNYRRDVGAGANKLDATVRGLNFAQLEFAGLLSVFGSKNNATGKTGIKVEDLRVMYEKGQIPPGMQGQSSSVIEAMALQASLAIKSDANVAAGALSSVFTSKGLSDAGARLSGGGANDGVGQSGQLASMSAGKAAACPHMGGAVKKPAGPAEVVNAHTL